MKKALLIAVIFFASFVSGNISGQQNTINTENASKSESVIKDSKPGNGNSSNLIPSDSGDLNNDKIEDSAKELPAIQKTQKQKTENSKNTIIKSDEIYRKTEQKQLPTIKLPDKPVIGNGLMEINDGDFRYKRIPGISLNTEKPVETPIAENNTEDKHKDTKDLSDVNGNKEKSSFGISKSTAVIVLLIALIVIIIIFKIRSKTTGDKNVLRRFPGMK
jgi:hypothetical protein